MPTPLVPLTVKIPAADRAALEHLARKLDRSISWLVRGYIAQILCVGKETLRGKK